MYFNPVRNGGFCMGETLVVRGGRPLYGAADTPAAKNSVLPLLAAALLCDGEVRLHSVPALSDVESCLAILAGVGTQVRRAGHSVLLRTDRITATELLDGPVGRMRASILFAAPLLARAGRVTTAMPGGCRLGPRPIDLHLAGLEALGAAARWGRERLTLEAPRGLRGTDHTLRYPSVGATETMLLAAVTARGETVLRGAACEPEIADLAKFLNLCGARISGAGTPLIRVTGVRALHGAACTPIPDRIVAATMVCAAAAAGGEVTVRKCDPAAFAPVLAVLRLAGCGVQISDTAVTVARRKPLNGVGRVFTGVYPAFPTDAAPLTAAALLCAAGESSIEDTVFSNRFACARGFAAMGARVETEGAVLTIRPGGGLRGADVAAPDLRGGAALAVAALACPEPVRIGNAGLIARGYEDLPRLLRRLGAQARHV